MDRSFDIKDVLFADDLLCFLRAPSLASWIGHADLRAVNENATAGVGPVAQALDSGKFDAAFLLTDHDAEGGPYLRWLKERSDGVEIHLRRERLTGPTEFGEIYTAAVRACEQAIAVAQGDALTFHLSPGTPAMAAVWIILGKTRFPAAMIESSLQHGVKTVSVPFDIAADFLPDLLRRPDRELERLSAGLPPEAPEFDTILCRSPVMRRVICALAGWRRVRSLFYWRARQEPERN